MGMAENTRERGREQAGMSREGRRTMEKVLENTVRDTVHENTTGVEKPPSPVTEGPPLKRCRHFLPVIPLLPPSPERKQKRKDSHAPF